MTPQELRAKAVELERKAQTLAQLAAKENRDLDDAEDSSVKSWLDEADKLRARATRLEEIDARVNASINVGQTSRTTSPIEFNNSIEAGENEADRREGFSHWLSCVDTVCDRRSSQLDHDAAYQLLQSQYRSQFRKWDDPKRSKEVRAMAMASGTSGGFLMPEQFYAQLMAIAGPMSLVRPRALVIQAQAQIITIPSLDQTTVPTAGNPPYYGGVVLTWSGESATIASTEPGFRQVKITLSELTGYTPVGRSLLRYSPISLEPIIYNLFAGALSFAEDYAFLRGNGVGKPLGLLDVNAAARVKTSARGSASAITFANATSVWTKVVPESQSAGVFVVSKAAENAVLQMTGTANSVFIPTGLVQGDGTATVNAGPSGVMLYMRPVLVSTKLPALNVDGDFNFFDFSKYVIAEGGPPEVASSDDFLFRTNERAFRIVHHVGGSPWLNSYITLEDATTTVSPFVSLGVQ